MYGRVMRGNIASIKVMEKQDINSIEEVFGAEDDPYGRWMLLYEHS